MSDVFIEIRVISDNKATNKAIINDLDAALLKAWPTIEKEVQVEFKNIRTRVRKPTVPTEAQLADDQEPVSDPEGVS